MKLILEVLLEAWHLLLDASIYIILGLIIAGLLKSYLSAAFVARHLGRGRFLPVLKAALLGIPIPLCSCGVMPAAAALKKQGASNGASIAFLISTPESGVDSITVSYALLDPLLTVARPVAAFISALAAGFLESLFGPPPSPPVAIPITQVAHTCSPDGAVDPAQGSSWRLWSGTKTGLRYAFGELWSDLAGWFAFGLLLSGLITVLIPDDLIAGYLGGGPVAMLIMLAVGIPIYICASASTPIAASLILKGVSPGAALVFLLAGPATNIASLSMLTGLLGRNGTLRYLFSLAVSSFLCGLLLDQIYTWSGLSAKAVIGQAAEIVPFAWQLGAALLLVILSIRPIYCALMNRGRRMLAYFTGRRDSSDSCRCPSDSC
jgi:hypothetical protein